MIKKIVKNIFPEKLRINFRLFIRKIIAVFYMGRTYKCVCCGKGFRKFRTHGNIPRSNARCPSCGSLERTRVLYLYLQKETDIFNGDHKVLHFAPEKALEKKLKKDKENYISADINPALADVVVDITDIQYPDNSFDYIICSHVLGHVPAESKAIDEVFRVLKPKGRAIFLTLINKEMSSSLEDDSIVSEQDRLKHYGEIDLVRLHGADFLDRVSRENMDVKEVDYRLSYNIKDQKRFGLGNGYREVIYDCQKH